MTEKPSGLILVSAEEAAFIVQNVPEYVEGMVTSWTLARWRRALNALTPAPAGRALPYHGEAIPMLVAEIDRMKLEVKRMRMGLSGPPWDADPIALIRRALLHDGTIDAVLRGCDDVVVGDARENVTRILTVAADEVLGE